MAANLSRNLTLFKAEHSLLPFLYQTRTLTALPSHLRRKSRCRLYSTDTPSDEPADIAAQAAGSSSQEQPTTTATSNEDAPKSRNYLKKRGIASARGKSTGYIPSAPKNRSTMTRTEKEILAKLSRQVDNSLQSQKQGNEKEKEKEQEKTEVVKKPRKKTEAKQKPLGVAEKQELSELSRIFEEAVNDAKSRAEETSLGQERTDVESEGRKSGPMLERHIPNIDVELQRISTMFERIRRFKYSDVDVSDRARTITVEKVVELAVGIESEKIQTALQAAIDQGKGDLGLWEICEERVFGMLQHLDIYDGVDKDTNGVPEHQPDEIESTGSSKTSQSLSTEKTETKHPSGPLDIPPFVPVYPVVSALYPNMLFTALNLFKTHFPNSPLIGQFLPTIKSHGRTSTVLGASTKLYNELMDYYWRVCDDLPTVVSLLEEMDSTGVEPNLWTYSLVKRIIRTRTNEKQAHRRRMLERSEDAVKKEEWFETEPNRKALRELSGSKKKPGWVHHLKSRLHEVSERRKMENEDVTTELHSDFAAPIRKFRVD